jgi:transcriptional regulator with XRE-family HTH domain
MGNAAGVTRAELAAALGVSQARISKIEHGEISGIDVVRAYVSALGGSIDVCWTVVAGRRGGPAFLDVGVPPDGDGGFDSIAGCAGEKVTAGRKLARRAARRNAARTAGPASRIASTFVIARPVSQPSEVVASKSR